MGKKMYFKEEVSLSYDKPIDKDKSEIFKVSDSTTPEAGYALILRINATHSGYVTGNKTLYKPECMQRSAPTFFEDYAKPFLVHHQKDTDPIGRVFNAEYIGIEPASMADAVKNTYKPDGYIQLYAKITDQKAIQKTLDGRYSTVSIGGTTADVRCSVCNRDIANDGICQHKKGKKYDKKECYWVIGDMEYTEVSFVNRPADKHSSIVSKELTTNQATAKMYASVGKDNVLDMHTDAVVNVFDNAFTNANVDISSELQHYLQESHKEGGIEVVDDNKNKNSKTVDDIAGMSDADIEALEDDVLNKDAKLSAASRKKLPDSVFCGPNRSYPAQDKAHVRSGIAYAKKYNASKSILQCLYRKGRALGMKFTSGPSKKADGTEGGIVTKGNVEELLLGDATIEQIMDTDTFKSWAKDNIPDEAKALKEQVKALETERDELKKQVDDVDEERKLLQGENETLLRENKEMKVKDHRSMAEKVVDLRISLGRKDMESITKETDEDKKSEARKGKIEEFAQRKFESLKDALDDLAAEIGSEVPTRGDKVPLPVNDKVDPPRGTQDGKPGTKMINEKTFKTRKEHVEYLLEGKSVKDNE